MNAALQDKDEIIVLSLFDYNDEKNMVLLVIMSVLMLMTMVSAQTMMVVILN